MAGSIIRASKAAFSNSAATCWRYRPFLNRASRCFGAQTPSKGLQFPYHPAPNLPAFVQSDEKRFSQIHINLLSNALKYTPREVRG